MNKYNAEVFEHLSRIERRILAYFIQGLPGAEIAARMNLTENTIKKYHMTSIYKKLGIHNDDEHLKRNQKHKSKRLMVFLHENGFR